MSAQQDAKVLADAPANSDDWDDETWGAWWRHCERVHGDAPSVGAAQKARLASPPSLDELLSAARAQTAEQAAEIERLRVMYEASSQREHDLIEERDRLRAELAKQGVALRATEDDLAAARRRLAEKTAPA